MSTRPKNPAQAPDEPFEERRVAHRARGVRRIGAWVRSVLRRPLGLQWKGAQLHVVLVERRRTPHRLQPPTLDQIRAELRTRLLAHEHHQAAHVMRHLVLVHDRLGRKGWAGLDGVPARVLGKALVQAEMLAGDERSPALEIVIERLRVQKVAAGIREERGAPSAPVAGAGAGADSPEVTESTHEEFAQMERSWVGTQPGELTLEQPPQ